jgi:thioester reductase-like protein
VRVASAHDRITQIVAAFLHAEPETIDPQRPLALYGLDSAGSIELIAALEDAVGRELPEWLLLEHPDLDGLTRALCDDPNIRTDDALGRMLADSRLPDDIRPSGGSPATPARRVLLTGASGFLGAYLLRDLFGETEAEIWCLVRGSANDVGHRLRSNLERYGLDASVCADRVRTISGDLTLPNFGLSASRYRELSEALDAIFHAAADVNWVLPYEALRDANVIATRELIRLACAVRPKAFHFISSLSVCYATGGPLVVQEGEDMLPYVDRLPLGYAQSKCVSESLARTAAIRGLPVWIHRPPLIVGDSQTGASNLDDLVAILLKGCIEMKAAPDLDWVFDATPVDHVSRAIVRLSRTTECGVRTSHLHHPVPRHWRECVLWMNLFGYPVQLLPYAEWLARLTVDAESPHHALHRLRGFFLRRSGGGVTVPELYQQSARSAVAGDLTQKATAAVGLTYPRLDAELFDRYFAGYLEREFLPPPRVERRSRRSAPPRVACYENPRFLERLLREHYADQSVCVEQMALTPFGNDHSIISELTSWQRQQPTGLFTCRLTLQRSGAIGRREIELVIKAKPSDRDALDVGATVASVCDSQLADAFRTYRGRIGLTGGHLREIAIYQQSDERLRRHLPRCFGTWCNDENAEWGMALEHLREVVLMDEVNPEAWSPRHIDAVMAGLNDIHSVWYGREQELSGAPWLGEPLTLERALELTPLWRALAAHAAPHFTSWAGPSVARTHSRLVETIGEWWQPLNGVPRTLIHNDFSPRNVTLRQDPGGFRLCAYDWELATFGPPQRDLAEFLCFVLAPNLCAEVAERRVDEQRRLLEAATGRFIPHDLWRAGFSAALADLLIDKLAFYAMVNRVRPQRFLPRVMRTWRRLYGIFSHEQDS